MSKKPLIALLSIALSAAVAAIFVWVMNRFGTYETWQKVAFAIIAFSICLPFLILSNRTKN